MTRQRTEPEEPVYAYPHLASWQPTPARIAALIAWRRQESASRRQAAATRGRTEREEDWPVDAPFREVDD